MSAMKQGSYEISLVDQAIQWHEDDLRATIATLIEDCRLLRERLYIAECCMSRGLTRGWQPSSAS